MNNCSYVCSLILSLLLEYYAILHLLLKYCALYNKISTSCLCDSLLHTNFMLLISFISLVNL